MGWSDWWSGNDPLKDVDPSLRNFLKDEAPKKYTPEASKRKDSQTYRSQLGLESQPGVDKQLQQQAYQAAQRAGTVQEGEDDIPVPKESLFPDGRYKHLWKTYRPVAELEEAGKSDQEKLNDVVSGYKERRAEMSRAAMENCSIEQWNVHQCFRSGSWGSVATMCKAENRKFNRCWEMNSRFLRALGYMSMYDRPQEESDRIQMHADRLYHDMLEEEEAVAEAKKQGLPARDMDAFIKERLDAAGAPEPTWKYKDWPERLKKKHEEGALKGLEGADRELAVRAIEQDAMRDSALVETVSTRYNEEYIERRRRREAGEERFGDRVKRMFDMRKYPAQLDEMEEARTKQEAPEKGQS